MNNVSKAYPPGQWTTGLCDCFDNCGNCCLTCCCPCVTFGWNAEVIDKAKTSCGFAGCMFFCASLVARAFLYSFEYRGKLREIFSLPEDPYNDYCVHFFCVYCAICQEYRELKNRGFDPSLGWSGNEEKMKQINQMPPNVAPGMTR